MDGKIHFAYIFASILAILAYLLLLLVLHISRYCIRKCPSFITGRRPQRAPDANSQIPQQSGRRVIVLTAKDLQAQGFMIPNAGAHPEMLPANFNSPMTQQQMAQFNGLAGNTQNFLTQEKICQNNEQVAMSSIAYPGNYHQPLQLAPTAPTI
ncbi:unnamed protein product [Chironomus riparius]|uniref:Uncharacterized protein n=1 Tax=Chironomus riparius TaxID=315576 RepID=A0A9N9RZ37_9DIPT|nr:unnamed protein product [Chironomus riparius]